MLRLLVFTVNNNCIIYIKICTIFHHLVAFVGMLLIIIFKKVNPLDHKSKFRFPYTHIFMKHIINVGFKQMCVVNSCLFSWKPTCTHPRTLIPLRFTATQLKVRINEYMCPSILLVPSISPGSSVSVGRPSWVFQSALSYATEAVESRLLQRVQTFKTMLQTPFRRHIVHVEKSEIWDFKSHFGLRGLNMTEALYLYIQLFMYTNWNEITLYLSFIAPNTCAVAFRYICIDIQIYGCNRKNIVRTMRWCVFNWLPLYYQVPFSFTHCSLFNWWFTLKSNNCENFWVPNLPISESACHFMSFWG